MARIWITNGTPTMPGLLNPIAAACDNGYIPDEARILSNPGVAESVAAASDMFETIIDAHGGDAAVSEHRLETETDFQGIIEFYRSAIEAAHEDGDTIAVDVTPGRKFMSAIAFQAGFRFGADHGGVQIRMKSEAERFLSGLCSKSPASTVVTIASS